ncbi:MAG: sigma-70 family RNA polymerase sigma factor [Planctomycetes bacterium]|nr:sigma-70 family RNA polymerase sigma factor [Planctomycetota bacterium]
MEASSPIPLSAVSGPTPAFAGGHGRVGARALRDARSAARELPGRDAATSSDVEDAAVVRAILDGEPDAFGELVGRYHRRAFWVAFHVVGRAEDARDVVQEAFVRVHRSLQRFDFERSFYTWFHRIVMNLAIDALRKRRSARAVELDVLGERAGDDDGPDAPAERAELRGRVWEVLEKLDAKFKAVLVLRDIHGLSCREIAPILGVTHATARWRLHRGRQVFREQWERLDRLEGSSGP